MGQHKTSTFPILSCSIVKKMTKSIKCILYPVNKRGICVTAKKERTKFVWRRITDFRFDSQQGQDFFFPAASRSVLRPTQPSVRWVTRDSSPRTERLVCEAEHSPSSNAQQKIGGAIPPSPPPHILWAQCLIKPSENFTFSSKDVIQTFTQCSGVWGADSNSHYPNLIFNSASKHNFEIWHI
jgi:hypothetical protein